MSNGDREAILDVLQSFRWEIRRDIQLIRTDIQQLRADMAALESRRNDDIADTKKKSGGLPSFYSGWPGEWQG